MALNNTTADAAATSLCSSLGITDPTTVGVWKTVFRQMYSSLKTDVVITISINAITTVGSAATQAGPTPAPVSISPA